MNRPTLPLGAATPDEVLVTALDGIDLRLGFDPETRLHMLRPSQTDKVMHG